MNINDFESMTVFQKEVIMLLEKILKSVKSLEAENDDLNKN